jgi:TP901 family phage tail tape measure protein
MADLEKIIRVVFEGKDELSVMMKSLDKGFNDMADNIQAATQPIADFGMKIAEIEGIILAAGAAMIGFSINEAGKFSDAFNEIASISGASSDALNEFRGDVVSYARDSVKSLEDINGAIYDAVSSGVSYKDSLEVLSVAEKLSVAGKADLNNTLRVLVGTLNSYGVGMDEAAKYSDILFQTVNYGVTTVPELTQSIAQVTNIAAAAKIPFEEVGAALVALTRSGVPTAEAVTYLKGTITDIIKPSSQAADVAKQLGIEFNASALQSKGLSGVLDDVARATGGNVTQMGLLFGDVRALNGALTLTGIGADVFKDSLDGMAKAAGATEAAYKVMAQNMELINQNLINNMRATLINAGTPLLDEYKGIAESISNVFAGISSGIDEGAFDPLFEMFEQLGVDIADYLNKIAEVLPEALSGLDFSGLVASFENLGESVKELFQAFFGDIDLTTIEGLQEALQKIVDLFAGSTNFTAGFVEGLRPLIAIAGQIADGFLAMDEKGQQFAGNVSGWAQTINTATGALQGIEKALYALVAVSAGNFLTSLGTGFVSLGVSIASVLTPVAALAGSAGIGYLIGTLINKIPGVSQAAQGFAELTDEIFNWTGTKGEVNEWSEDSKKNLDALIQRMKDFKESTKGGIEVVGELINLPPIEIEINADPKNVEKSKNEIIYELEQMQAKVPVEVVPSKNTYLYSGMTDDGTIYFSDVPTGRAGEKRIIVPVDLATKDAEKKAIELKNNLDEVLKLELQIKGEKELETIKQNAETVREAIKWKAELDIANVKANAEIVMTISNNIAEQFKSTGDVLQTLFGNFADTESMSKRFSIETWIEREYDMRQKALDMQKELNNAQLEYMQAKIDQINRGESTITINGDGLAPHLEAFMWEVLSAIQVRVNEEGLDMLLGI